jgi:hypothetical protein
MMFSGAAQLSRGAKCTNQGSARSAHLGTTSPGLKRTIRRSSVAQRIEQPPTKRTVAGSSPARYSERQPSRWRSHSGPTKGKTVRGRSPQAMQGGSWEPTLPLIDEFQGNSGLILVLSAQICGQGRNCRREPARRLPEATSAGFHTGWRKRT